MELLFTRWSWRLGQRGSFLDPSTLNRRWCDQHRQDRLESFQEYTVKLPLLENPVSFVPFVELSALGSTLDRRSFTGAQLAVIFDGPHHPDRGTGQLLQSWWSA